MTLGFVRFLAYTTPPEPKTFHLRGCFLPIFPGNYELQQISGRALTMLFIAPSAADPNAPHPAVMIAISAFWICIGAVILYGGINFRRLRNHRAAMVGAIAALFPCSCLFPLSVPVGVWSLIGLRDPEVKAAFARGTHGFSHTGTSPFRHGELPSPPGQDQSSGNVAKRG